MRQPRCDKVFGARPYDNSTGGVPVAPLATKDSSFCWHHLASSVYIFLFASQAACMHTFNMWYTEMYNSHQFTVYLLCNVVQTTMWCTILSEKKSKTIQRLKIHEDLRSEAASEMISWSSPLISPAPCRYRSKGSLASTTSGRKNIACPDTDKFTEPTIHVVSSRAADAS